jgi:pimeloyl-ACP methyl ester carboxylesterase
MTATAQVTRGGLAFTITEDGPADGEPVLLLHGFPQRSDSWDDVVPPLVAAGYRVLRMDQRGYSPGARPTGRYAYRISELVEDVAAVIDHYGGRVHLVGHDWGAGVAWMVAIMRPEKLISLTAVSVPHVGAFLRSFLTSTQGLKSWYMYLFQLPLLPEWLLRRFWIPVLTRTGLPEAAARRDKAGLSGTGALTGALNYYRAMPFMNIRSAFRPVTTPTLYIWSDGDGFLGETGAKGTARYVSGPYRFETISGASHWIAEEQPARLAELIISQAKAFPRSL